MVEIATDRRRIEAADDPEAERLAAAVAADYLDARLRLARLLVRIERAGTYHLSAASSIVQYAVRLGVPAVEARMLVDLGRTLEAADLAAAAAAAAGSADDVSATPATEDGATSAAPAESVEERIRAGKLPVENAAIVGRLLAQPDAIRPGDDWLTRAETLRTPELRQQVRQRLEETAQGAGPLVSVTVHVTERTREEFHRARVLASREAAVPVTEGQTFTRLVRFYLDARDERRRAPGTRRVGPTSCAPDERYVPADVRRRVVARSGDRCEVPGCALDTFLQLAHVVSHAEGSGREAEDLLRLCHVHHTQFDADVLLFGGWREGRPVFRDARGVEITSGLARGAAGAAVGASRERTDGLVAAVAARRALAAQVSERPPPAWPLG